MSQEGSWVRRAIRANRLSRADSAGFFTVRNLALKVTVLLHRKLDPEKARRARRLPELRQPPAPIPVMGLWTACTRLKTGRLRTLNFD